MNQLAVLKDAHGRRAAAHVDDGHAQPHFVLNQRRQARDIGRDRHFRDRQVAAFDTQGKVLQRAGADGHDVDVDAKLGAEHAAGIAHAVDAVDRKAGRQRVKDGPAFGLLARTALFENAAQIGVTDLVAGPLYSTAVGLALYGYRNREPRSRFELQDPAWYRRVRGRFAEWIRDLF